LPALIEAKSALPARDPSLFASRTLPPLLSILIVDTHGGDSLARVIRELRDLRLGMPLEVLGVVGGQDPARLAELQREFPLVTLHGVWDRTDRGSLLAKGAEAAQGRYVLVLDGTTTVDAATIDGMIQFMDKGQWVGVVGPRLLKPDGADAPSARAFPTVSSALDLVMGRQKAAATEPAPRLQYALNRQVTTPKEVDAIDTGCCMIRKKAIQEVGAWDDGYAPGGEALDWCRRARLRGWSVFYHPGVTARLHAQDAADPAAVAVELATALRYLGRYGGFGTVGVLKLMLAAVTMRAMLVQGAASLVPGTHRPTARFGFWRAWHALGAILAPRRAAA
jgi:GT2 family glycosyltransferase